MEYQLLLLLGEVGILVLHPPINNYSIGGLYSMFRHSATLCLVGITIHPTFGLYLGGFILPFLLNVYFFWVLGSD